MEGGKFNPPENDYNHEFKQDKFKDQIGFTAYDLPYIQERFAYWNKYISQVMKESNNFIEKGDKAFKDPDDIFHDYKYKILGLLYMTYTTWDNLYNVFVDTYNGQNKNNKLDFTDIYEIGWVFDCLYNLFTYINNLLKDMSTKITVPEIQRTKEKFETYAEFMEKNKYVKVNKEVDDLVEKAVSHLKKMWEITPMKGHYYLHFDKVFVPSVYIIYLHTDEIFRNIIGFICYNFCEATPNKNDDKIATRLKRVLKDLHDIKRWLSLSYADTVGNAVPIRSYWFNVATENGSGKTKIEDTVDYD